MLCSTRISIFGGEFSLGSRRLTFIQNLYGKYLENRVFKILRYFSHLNFDPIAIWLRVQACEESWCNAAFISHRRVWRNVNMSWQVDEISCQPISLPTTCIPKQITSYNRLIGCRLSQYSQLSGEYRRRWCCSRV